MLYSGTEQRHKDNKFQFGGRSSRVTDSMRLCCPLVVFNFFTPTYHRCFVMRVFRLKVR